MYNFIITLQGAAYAFLMSHNVMCQLNHMLPCVCVHHIALMKSEKCQRYSSIK